MKILHTADIHLKEYGDERWQALQKLIAIGGEDARLRANADELIVLPKSDPHVHALLAVLPLQLMAYHMSVLRGLDPDFPRNLSKTLTVD